MAKTVKRYKLPDTYPSPASLPLAPDARVVHVDLRMPGEVVQVWVEDDVSPFPGYAVRTRRHFQLVLTGDTVPEGARHVGSAQIDRGTQVGGDRWYVVHLYEL